MVGEGIEPASVEQAAAQAGYPAKVLSLMDELTLTLPRKIRGETRRAVEEAGGTWTAHPADAVIDRMVDEFGRTGRGGGAGFYTYGEDGRRTGLWPGLREHFTREGAEIPFVDMQERMLFSEALDTVRLLEEGVLTSVADANIGSTFGIGFPGWTGGVLQYVNGYEGGLPGFVARARELAERYGERFTPPALLVEKAERGRPSATGADLAEGAGAGGASHPLVGVTSHSLVGGTTRHPSVGLIGALTWACRRARPPETGRPQADRPTDGDSGAPDEPGGSNSRSSSFSDRWKAVSSACNTRGCMCSDSDLTSRASRSDTSSRKSRASSWAAARECSRRTLREARITSCDSGTSSSWTPSRSRQRSAR